MKTNRMFNRNSALLPAALLLAAGSMACSDAPAGPAANPGDMTLSVGVTQTAAPVISQQGGYFDLVLADGSSTLTLTRVAMVIRVVEL